ncbi:hypothetical protein BOTBODRAFT_39390 [Botryobasidium botryosum FD-172 SS1]|uniref:B30.2/SPRY domain-containing protein n=1 Tax=Botryobasidium botryosum (strain FD-172 SS1) TaxID=930990 RepID=A0A067LTW0_BOTB1|nr:hypothetical protein BOTBODRAFT_39390 [Botryobasidium botryosum FD-172 SS1]
MDLSSILNAPDSGPGTPTYSLYTPGTQAVSRKRKLASLLDGTPGPGSSASSPGPSESAHPPPPLPLQPSTPADAVNEDCDAEQGAKPAPVLVSRAPTFVPTPDASSIYNSTVDTPMNRQNFRYVPAGPPIPGSTLTFRTLESPPAGCARVCWEDRSPFVKVTTDGLGLTGEKGFRSARCNAPVKEGKWYLEVKIEKGVDSMQQASVPGSPHVRLGWGRREAPLNGPVGLDGYSYGMRDMTGEKVTLSRPRPYGRSFGTGDVVGLYISLPPRRTPNPTDAYDPARLERKRIPIQYKGQLYFESMDYPASKEMIALMDYSGKNKPPTSTTATADSSVPIPPPPSTKKSATVKKVSDRGRNQQPPLPERDPLRPLPILPDSSIAFFVNGECQGPAFKDIYSYLQLRLPASARKGENAVKKTTEAFLKERENHFDDGSLGYYPFISIYGGARVRINPGPNFDFPPPPNIDAVLSKSSQTDPANDPTEMGETERTWRPLCERYPEYMAEIWEMDDKEEAEAQAAQAALDKAEQSKLEKGKKRKQRAEERKRAKREAEHPAHTDAITMDAIDDIEAEVGELNHRFGVAAAGFLTELHNDTPPVYPSPTASAPFQMFDQTSVPPSSHPTPTPPPAPETEEAEAEDVDSDDPIDLLLSISKPLSRVPAVADARKSWLSFSELCGD